MLEEMGPPPIDPLLQGGDEEEEGTPLTEEEERRLLSDDGDNLLREVELVRKLQVSSPITEEERNIASVVEAMARDVGEGSSELTPDFRLGMENAPGPSVTLPLAEISATITPVTGSLVTLVTPVLEVTSDKPAEEKMVQEVEVPEVQTSAEQTSAEQTSAKQTSAEQTSAEQTSAVRTSAEQTSAVRTSAEQTSAVQTSAVRTSAEQTFNEPLGLSTLIGEQTGPEGAKSPAKEVERAMDTSETLVKAPESVALGWSLPSGQRDYRIYSSEAAKATGNCQTPKVASKIVRPKISEKSGVSPLCRSSPPQPAESKDYSSPGISSEESDRDEEEWTTVQKKKPKRKETPADRETRRLYRSTKVPCTECGAFIRRGNLTRHTKERHSDFHFFYTCPLCDTSTERRSDLNRHLTRVHGHEPQQARDTTAALQPIKSLFDGEPVRQLMSKERPPALQITTGPVEDSRKVEEKTPNPGVFQQLRMSGNLPTSRNVSSGGAPPEVANPPVGEEDLEDQMIRTAVKGRRDLDKASKFLSERERKGLTNPSMLQVAEWLKTRKWGEVKAFIEKTYGPATPSKGDSPRQESKRRKSSDAQGSAVPLYSEVAEGPRRRGRSGSKDTLESPVAEEMWESTGEADMPSLEPVSPQPSSPVRVPSPRKERTNPSPAPANFPWQLRGPTEQRIKELKRNENAPPRGAEYFDSLSNERCRLTRDQSGSMTEEELLDRTLQLARDLADYDLFMAPHRERRDALALSFRTGQEEWVWRQRQAQAWLTSERSELLQKVGEMAAQTQTLQEEMVALRKEVADGKKAREAIDAENRRMFMERQDMELQIAKRDKLILQKDKELNTLRMGVGSSSSTTVGPETPIREDTSVKEPKPAKIVRKKKKVKATQPAPGEALPTPPASARRPSAEGAAGGVPVASNPATPLTPHLPLMPPLEYIMNAWVTYQSQFGQQYPNTPVRGENPGVVFMPGMVKMEPQTPREVEGIVEVSSEDEEEDEDEEGMEH